MICLKIRFKICAANVLRRFKVIDHKSLFQEVIYTSMSCQTEYLGNRFNLLIVFNNNHVSTA